MLLDTPGLHKPRTVLGERTNERARATLAEVDVVCVVVEANAPIGQGDRFVADLVRSVDTPRVLVVNKTDAASREQIADHLAVAEDRLGGPSTPTCRARRRTGDGVDALVAELESRLEPGPHYYPDGVVTDQPETFLAAELLREQLLRVARDEVPHSIAVACELLEDEEDAHHPEDVLRLARDGRRRARLAEGDRDREGRRGAQGGGHGRPQGARGAARLPGLPGDPRPGANATGSAGPRCSTASGTETGQPPGRHRGGRNRFPTRGKSC